MLAPSIANPENAWSIARPRQTAETMPQGTPIKVTTTTTFSGIREIAGFQSYVANDPTMDKVTVIQQTQLTSIQPADVDAKLLVVPDSSAN
jgi:hypothetical protein